MYRDSAGTWHYSFVPTDDMFLKKLLTILLDLFVEFRELSLTFTSSTNVLVL